jgi:hypothetical protein
VPKLVVELVLLASDREKAFHVSVYGIGVRNWLPMPTCDAFFLHPSDFVNADLHDVDFLSRLLPKRELVLGFEETTAI